MEEAIKKAIEGGWKPEYKDHKIKKAYKRSGSWMEKGNASSFLDWKYALLDPLFWQALGKAMGWDSITKTTDFWYESHSVKGGPHEIGYFPEWNNYWFDFVRHLSEGKPAEEFFTNLLKK